MGHRHTPEDRGRQGALCGAEGGSAAAARKRAEAVVSRDVGRLDVRAALFALRFYKTNLSFLFAGNCRFVPTCSEFAYQAIERFGVRRGVWLGFKRLLCCHPLSRRFGYDPVPENSNHGAPAEPAVRAVPVRDNSAELPHEVSS